MMRTFSGACLCVLAVAGVPGSAEAQSPRTYVSALLAGDVVRGASSDNDLLPIFSGLRNEQETAAPALLLRAGTPIGERWGVEIEAGFGGSIEGVRSYDVSIFAISAFTSPPEGFLPPPFSAYEIRTSHRRATVGASVWARRPVGERAGLTFTGGLVFTRVHTEDDIRFDDPFALSIFPASLESTGYGVGPMAGIETDVRLTRALSMTAGIRLHSENIVGRAWVIRPAAGLRWSF